MSAQSAAIVRVDRALDALAEYPAGATLEELCSKLEMSRPAALRLFESMVETGIAVRVESKRYRLSLKLYEWGNSSLTAHAPSFTARREMARLANAARQRVWYAVLERGFAITLERVEYVDGDTVTFPVANSSPWWLTAGGVMIAAFSPANLQEQLLSDARKLTRKEPELETPLELAREKAMAWRHYGESGLAAASPILDASGNAIAAMGITMLSTEGLDVESLQRLLRDAAAQSSNYIGYSRALFVT